VNPWKRLNEFNSDLARLFALRKSNGRFEMSKTDRIIMLVLAPPLVVLFAFVRKSLVRQLGKGYLDLAVRFFLEELFITFLIFSVLAFVYCLFQPKWLERILESAVGKIVLVVEFIYLAPFIILLLSAVSGLVIK
jgi:hypothetical protein